MRDAKAATSLGRLEWKISIAKGLSLASGNDTGNAEASTTRGGVQPTSSRKNYYAHVQEAVSSRPNQLRGGGITDRRVPRLPCRPSKCHALRIRFSLSPLHSPRMCGQALHRLGALQTCGVVVVKANHLSRIDLPLQASFDSCS